MVSLILQKINGEEIQSYSYDSLNQLIRENNAETNQTVVFEYDNHGNILSKTVYPFNEGELSDENKIKEIPYVYSDAWKDLLTEYNGQTITYDQIGNPLSYRDGMSFKWSGDRKLTSFTLNNGASYVNGEYVYDDSGIRVYKNINGNETKYYLNGSTILTEITNFGGVTRRVDYIYDESGSIYGFSVDGVDYYYVKNLQGDIIGILDKTGNLLVEYIYDAYGVPTVSFPGITETSTDAEKNTIYLLGYNNPFRYRGYYYDTESGLYYLNSRYYDPVTGRFINADSVVSGVGGELLGNNPFAYCMNNPINLHDEGGTWPKLIRDIGKKIKNTVVKIKEAITTVCGVSVNVDNEQMIERQYYFAITLEAGTGYNKTFETDKPINYYKTVPENPLYFWKGGQGVDVNFNGFGINYQFGNENSISYHIKNSSLEFGQNRLGRIYMKHSYIDSSGIYAYNKFSINTMEIGGAVLIAICAPSVFAAVCAGASAVLIGAGAW